MEYEIDVPPYFLCPISLQIMKDPVTLSTGITYDRENIEKWVFTNSNTTCPVTKQVLVDTDFITPNHTLRRLIQSWCTLNASYGVERFPTPKPPVSKPQIVKLISDATRLPRLRGECLKKLRSIATESAANKRCLEAAGAAEFLSRIVIERNCPNETADVALAILAQLQVDDEKLRSVLEGTEGGALRMVNILARSLQRGGEESRGRAVELLKSVVQALEPVQLASSLHHEQFSDVIQVLRDRVSPRATKAALNVLSLACPWGRNRIRVVEAGAIMALLDLLLDANLEDRRLIEMTLVVLDHLCGCAEGRAAIVEHGAGLAVVSKKILRVSHFATERGVRILASIAKFSGSTAVLQEMAQIGVVTKLCLVLQVDCDANTKDRAREMLKLHARAWRNSPCVPAFVFNS